MTREQEIYIRGLIALYETTVEVYERKICTEYLGKAEAALESEVKTYKYVIKDLKKFLEMDGNNND